MLAHGKTWFVVAAVSLVTAIGAGVYHVAAPLAFIIDLSQRPTWIRSWLPVRLPTVATREIDVPTRYGPIRGRIYATTPNSRPVILVIPGVHGAGLDEPRLNHFSSRLAQMRFTVVTVPPPDLREYRITARATDQIEDAVLWVTSQPGLVPDGVVSLAGISFSGGLAVVAAGRPAVRNKLNIVVSLGGHGDMARSLEYMSTGRLADGTRLPPHDYSIAVFALTATPFIVPPAQVARLEHGIRTYLHASVDESASQTTARALLADARHQADALDEPARTILQLVNDRRVTELGPRLAPAIAEIARDASLSPERSPAPTAPVFLLHGAGDNVIPSTETPRLAAYLRSAGNPDVQALVTPLISHVGVASMTTGDTIRLLNFWRRMTSRMAAHN